MVLHDFALPNEVGKYNAKIVKVAAKICFAQKLLKTLQEPVFCFLANSVTSILSATAADVAPFRTKLILN